MEFWVFAESGNRSSSWIGHQTIEDAREDAKALLESSFEVAYIFPGDADGAHAHLDFLEQLRKETDRPVTDPCEETNWEERYSEVRDDSALFE